MAAGCRIQNYTAYITLKTPKGYVFVKKWSVISRQWLVVSRQWCPDKSGLPKTPVAHASACAKRKFSEAKCEAFL
jgi:hypothetical protein